MRAERAHLQRGNRQVEIIDRAGGRREVKHEIHATRDEDELRDVVLDEVKALVPREVLDVAGVSRDQIVDCDDAMTLGQQSIGEMRAKESTASRDDGDGTVPGDLGMKERI